MRGLPHPSTIAMACGLALWLFSGLVGAAAGASRGRRRAGFLLGLLLGPLGWLLALFLPGPAYRPSGRRRRL